MVIDFNNQIPFTNLQGKSFPQAETELYRNQKRERFGAGSGRQSETLGAAELTWTTMLACVVSSQSLSSVYVHRPGK